MSHIEGVSSTSVAATEASVVFETRRARDGKQLAIIRLNAPRALNALSLEMIERIELSWMHGSSIAASPCYGWKVPANGHSVLAAISWHFIRP
ncbi:hypothetical protein [Cobetia crustatorum]|uniref:hypothetical protein n=1 Tax=Cobetia crustatorum TaxID=553385 RepID=UPI0004B2B114